MSFWVLKLLSGSCWDKLRSTRIVWIGWRWKSCTILTSCLRTIDHTSFAWFGDGLPLPWIILSMSQQCSRNPHLPPSVTSQRHSRLSRMPERSEEEDLFGMLLLLLHPLGWYSEWIERQLWHKPLWDQRDFPRIWTHFCSWTRLDRWQIFILASLWQRWPELRPIVGFH